MPTPNNNHASHITWAGIWVTGLTCVVEGLIFYCFFYYQRRRKLDLYEPRQHNWSHRSPPPDRIGSQYWFKAAWNVPQEELLRCVGLDGYMFLRFLRLGFQLCCVGSLLAAVLIPVYATGRGVEKVSLRFDRWTLAGVKDEQELNWRLWVAVVAWYLFVAAALKALYEEWILYRTNYSEFLARGDIDMPKEYRYAVRVEQIPSQYCTDTALHDYFDRLFPQKVLQASVFWHTPKLDALIEERKQTIEKAEHVVAKLHAQPDEPRPIVRVDSQTGRAGLLTSVTSTVRGGGLVDRDALEYYESEFARLNQAIDLERDRLRQEIRNWNGETEVPDDEDDVDDPGLSQENKVTSTAHVTFTSLRSKQAAIQCELNGDPDAMIVVPAPDPDGVLWENVGVSLTLQAIFERQASALFTAVLMFWAIPVAFVTSIAKLNGILEAAGLPTFNPHTAWYGFVAGLLPVIFLAGFMVLLYKFVEAVAVHTVRYKSMTEVIAYSFYWHQLFQFANLWLIVIGGSFFDQLDLLLDNPRELIDIMATAMPGMAAFFINMIQFQVGYMGLEMSLIPAYGIRYLWALTQNEAKLTQRELDAAKKPPMIEWGRQVPPVVFIFLVILVYMPIVPIMEVFGAIYFGLYYIVFKHQCLHVYAQDFEGGGAATWQQLFPFLMICLYMGELIFIGYMGIKEAPTQSLLGFVPLIGTGLFHRHIRRTIIVPLKNLPLEIAANVDIEDGELVERDTKDASPLYGMPVLKTGSEEEREPLPYRREMPGEVTDVGRETITEQQDESLFLEADEDDGNQP